MPLLSTLTSPTLSGLQWFTCSKKVAKLWSQMSDRKWGLENHSWLVLAVCFTSKWHVLGAVQCKDKIKKGANTHCECWYFFKELCKSKWRLLILTSFATYRSNIQIVQTKRGRLSSNFAQDECVKRGTLHSLKDRQYTFWCTQWLSDQGHIHGQLVKQTPLQNTTYCKLNVSLRVPWLNTRRIKAIKAQQKQLGTSAPALGMNKPLWRRNS